MFLFPSGIILFKNVSKRRNGELRAFPPSRIPCSTKFQNCAEGIKREGHTGLVLQSHQEQREWKLFYCSCFRLQIRLSYGTSSPTSADPFGPAFAVFPVSPGKVPYGFLMARVHRWSKFIPPVHAFSALTLRSALLCTQAIAFH